MLAFMLLLASGAGLSTAWTSLDIDDDRMIAVFGELASEAQVMVFKLE